MPEVGRPVRAAVMIALPAFLEMLKSENAEAGEDISGWQLDAWPADRSGRDYWIARVEGMDHNAVLAMKLDTRKQLGRFERMTYCPRKIDQAKPAHLRWKPTERIANGRMKRPSRGRWEQMSVGEQTTTYCSWSELKHYIDSAILSRELDYEFEIVDRRDSDPPGRRKSDPRHVFLVTRTA